MPIPLADAQSTKTPFASLLCFAGLVAFGEAIRPDPIPNSAVKRFSANGTMSQDLGE
jgi:H+/gluconate symporter-like permease